MNIALTSLHKRILSGLAFGVIVWAGAFELPSVFGYAVLLLFAVVGLHEFYRLAACMEMPAFSSWGIAGGALMMLAGIARAYEPVLPATWWPVADESGLLVIFLLLLALCVRSFYEHEHRRSVQAVAVTLRGVLYGPYLLGFLLRMLFRWDPPAPLELIPDTGCKLGLFLLLVVKSGDMGAFFIGRRWGRHPLCPHLSPKKTWEGLAGGLFASIAVALVALAVMARLKPAPGGAWFGTLLVHWHDAAILGLLLSCVGVLGDLVESQLKRAADAKDSGTLIPGMGGLLDVLDSLLFAAPALYFYVIWFIE